MIAVPIGPRVQRFATAASPGYLDARGRPEHPRDLLAHACLRGQFASGAIPTWEFERDGEVVRVDPVGPLVVRLGAAVDLAVSAAVAGLGIIHLFEEWLRPHLDSGAWSRCWRLGGRAFQDRSCTIPAVAICRHRSALSSISSRTRPEPFCHRLPPHHGPDTCPGHDERGWTERNSGHCKIALTSTPGEGRERLQLRGDEGACRLIRQFARGGIHLGHDLADHDLGLVQDPGVEETPTFAAGDTAPGRRRSVPASRTGSPPVCRRTVAPADRDSQSIAFFRPPGSE